MELFDINENENEYELRHSLGELFILESKLNQTIPLIVEKSKHEDETGRLLRWKNYASLQIQRLEEILDIYDISLTSADPLQTDLISRDIQLQLSLKKVKTKNKEELEGTIRKLGSQEEVLLEKCLNLSNKLNFQEARDILQEAVAFKNGFDQTRTQASA
jgi:hypothetical protein